MYPDLFLKESSFYWFMIPWWTHSCFTWFGFLWGLFKMLKGIPINEENVHLKKILSVIPEYCGGPCFFVCNLPSACHLVCFIFHDTLDFYRLLSKFFLHPDWGAFESNTKLFNIFAHFCQPVLYFLLFYSILFEGRETQSWWCLRWVCHEVPNGVLIFLDTV